MLGLSNYGVLKGKVTGYDESNARRDARSPHVYIHLKSNGRVYQVPINVRSSIDIHIDGIKVPNELLYLADPNFKADQITHLQQLKEGFYAIKKYNEFVSEFYGCEPKDIAVDYVRSKLFNPCAMKIYKHNIPRPNNDLTDFLINHMKKAQDHNAEIYVYGEHFTNPLGIHDVHMNQGSNTNTVNYRGRLLKSSDGVYQDGCILLQYKDHWEVVFLAFQSQSWCTDDIMGNKKAECYIYNHETNKLICDIEK